jgi:hypothetical protein
MSKKEKDTFEICEMFMGKADVHRCFFGIIKRLTDNAGNPYVFSRIVVNDSLLCARAPEQKELGRNLDEMCVMILDKGLHDDHGVTKEIFGTDFFLN